MTENTRWVDGINDSVDRSLSMLQEMVKDLACCSPWGHKEIRLSNWTMTTIFKCTFA